VSMIAPIAPPSIVLRFGDSLPARDFAPIRRRMVLDCCKWDPQVGDVSTIAPFPLLIDRGSWQELEELAERLTAELLAAEDELLHRPDLHRKLAVPWRIRQALRAADSLGLTARELDVLALLVDGRTNRQIAEALYISVKTAGAHVSSILRKLDASTRTQAAAVALHAGLLDERAPGRE